MIEVHKKYDLRCLATDNPYLQHGHQPTDTEWTADPDGQCKFPRLWPPQTPPGKDSGIMTGRC